MITHKELKEMLTEEQIVNILKRLGSSEFQDKGNYLVFKSICHNLDENEAKFNLAYYKESKLFRCFSECGESFDIFGLVKRRLKLEGEKDLFKDNLFYFVLNHSNLDLDNYVPGYSFEKMADRYESKGLEVKLPNYSENVLDIFYDCKCIEWINDGISIEAMKKYNIRYSISRNKIIIPHYDVNNNLIGVRGRALNVEETERFGKYAPIRVEGKMYNHPTGLNLYGLNKAKNNIREYGIAIIGEAEKACLQAEAFLGDNNVVCATCGSTINKWQVLLLILYCDVKEIIIAFDKEDNKDNKYFSKIYKMCSKYKEYCNFSFIWDTKGLLELKESPFDKGKEVFNELLKRRVKVR